MTNIQRSAYTAARVLVGENLEALSDAAVIVEDGRITDIGPAGAVITDGHEVISLGEDTTILMGLVDVHAHLVWDGSRQPHLTAASETECEAVVRCLGSALQHLEAGVTAVRDLGSNGGVAITAAAGIRAGQVPGPEVVAAGRALTITGGQGWWFGSEADGLDAVRRAVREEIKSGAGCIKVMCSGGIYSPQQRPTTRQLTTEEVGLAVEEAHRVGLKVAAHAYSREAIESALEAGVDSIEHGSYLDKELAIRMADQGTYLVPTMSIYATLDRVGDEIEVPRHQQDQVAGVLAASRSAVRIAAEHGVCIAAGTDAGSPGHPHGALPQELEAMVDAGLSPAEALTAGTIAGARLADVEGSAGGLRAGAPATFIAVAGNPLSDISAIRSTEMVVKNGRIFRPTR